MAKYERRYKYELNLSQEQIDKIAIMQAILSGIEVYNLKGKDIPDINPEWWKSHYNWKKDVEISNYARKNLQKEGIAKWGRFIITKTKKGYILRLNKKYQFKGINKSKIVCSFCKKFKSVNYFCVCESCEAMLKKKRKYLKFMRGEYRD